MAIAKSNGASFDKDGAVNNCAGDNGGVAPIVSEVGAELKNLHLVGNPGCSSAATHDDALSLQKGTYRKLLTVKRQFMVNSLDGRVVWSVCLLSCRLGFDSESGQTSYLKIGIHSFSV